MYKAQAQSQVEPPMLSLDRKIPSNSTTQHFRDVLGEGGPPPSWHPFHLDTIPASVTMTRLNGRPKNFSATVARLSPISLAVWKYPESVLSFTAGSSATTRT